MESDLLTIYIDVILLHEITETGEALGGVYGIHLEGAGVW